MKFILSFILFFTFVCNSFAAPLVFKTAKLVSTLEEVELCSFDASKYKQIRIVVRVNNRPQEVAYSKYARIELDSAKRDLKRIEEGLQNGINSQYDLSRAKEKVTQAEQGVLYSKFLPITLYAVEDGEYMPIQEFESRIKDYSFVIESPPSKISIKVFGEGDYKVFVYGTT